MSKEVFDDLAGSVKQGGAILRGEQPASREFVLHRRHRNSSPGASVQISLSPQGARALLVIIEAQQARGVGDLAQEIGISEQEEQKILDLTIEIVDSIKAVLHHTD